MLVVADTSPVHYLVLVEQTALLPALYTKVVLPPAVITELQDPEAPEAVRAWVAALPAWCEVRRPTHRIDMVAFAKLGAGERDAIALAQELQADFVLIDEGHGRRVARACALTVTGTLGVLESAAVQGMIDLPRTVERLLTTSFYARETLIHALLDRDAARKRPRELLPPPA